MGGAERSLSRMCFASTNVEFELATLKAEGPWCTWVRAQGKSPIVLGKKGSHGGGIFWSFVSLFRYLRQHPVDIVYVCGVRAALWLRLLRFFIPGTKIVHGVRWNPDSNSRLDLIFRIVERMSSRFNDAWITNSEVAKVTLANRCGVPLNRIHVIYNGIDALPSIERSHLCRSMEVLTVANLSPRKGHREFLAVIKSVVQMVPESRFVFVGRDDMHGSVQQAIIDEGLAGSVDYAGFQADVSPWFRRARLFVLPSVWGEGCPTSILEAFSFGMPVIAHSIDGVPELVRHGEDGYLVQVGDPDLAIKIVELLHNPERAMLMGDAGRKKVAAHFLLQACIDQHEAVFKGLVR